MTGDDQSGGRQSAESRCPLSLFLKANRKLAIENRSDGLNRPRFGPRLATIHYRLCTTTVRNGCRLLRTRDQERYTDADPFKLIQVDPARIETISTGTKREYGSVVDGSWDRKGKSIEDDRVFQSMRQHFDDGVPWDETPLFEWFRDRIESGDPTAWTYEQYRSRFESVDDVYERINRDGYRSQRTLFDVDASRTLRQNNDCIHPYLNEVGVDIARDGTLRWRSGGCHRLFIAKLLDVPAIPVKVWSRHREWQAIRNQLRDGRSLEVDEISTVSHVGSHPDLADIERITDKT